MSSLAELLAAGKPATAAAKPAVSALSFKLGNASVPAPMPISTAPLASPAKSGGLVLKGIGAKPNPAPIPAPVTTPSLVDSIADISTLEISLTNDVADWPTIAHGDIDVSTLEGQLKALLNDLQFNIAGDGISDSLRRGMLFLEQNPAMADTLLPDEIGLFVTACEASYGMVISTKTENRSKSTTRKKASSDLAEAFADLKF